jgi:hypothetical protein
MATPRHWNRTPNQVYYEDPSSSTVQLRGIVRSAATFALQSGLLTDIGHCLYIVNDNRRQWELTGESTPWTKSLVRSTHTHTHAARKARTRNTHTAHTQHAHTQHTRSTRSTPRWRR